MPKERAQYPRMRYCARIAVCAAIGTMALSVACTRSDGAKTFGQASDRIPPEYRNVVFDAPRESCGLRTIGHATFKVLASVMPVGFRPVATHIDSLWSPNGVTAVLPVGDSLLVLDERQSKLTLFNKSLEPVATFGTPGEGPGEFRRATAITHDREGRVYIVDPGNSRLTVLTRQLRLDRTTPLPALRSIEAIALSDSDLYVSHYVMSEMMVRDRHLGELLGVLHPGSDSSDPIVRLKPGDPDTDTLLRLPGPNPFRVVAQNGYVLLIAPAIGVVDVFRNGHRTARLRACMPPQLSRALSAQLKAYRSGSAPNSQQWHPLVTDAIVVGDTVFVIGPLRDATKQLHIDKFRLDGSPLGSIVMPIGNAGFTEDVKFWGRPNRLIAFGPEGTLMLVGIEMQE